MIQAIQGYCVGSNYSTGMKKQQNNVQLQRSNSIDKADQMNFKGKEHPALDAIRGFIDLHPFISGGSLGAIIIAAFAYSQGLLNGIISAVTNSL